MSAQHTPGPWGWNYIDGKGGELCGHAGKVVIDHAHHEGMWFASYDETVDAANACLIAAAPDLLAALELLVNCGQVTATEWNAAHAAIAKARGQS
jgi:hypothetical protein